MTGAGGITWNCRGTAEGEPFTRPARAVDGPRQRRHCPAHRFAEISTGEMKIVLASNNAKKLKELDAILSPLGWSWSRRGTRHSGSG